jgi:hypothetical protein
MGRFFQIPAPFLIATGLASLARLAWLLSQKNIWARRLILLTLTTLCSIMLITPKIHLFYDLGVNDWGQANYNIKALEDLKQKPELFRVASVLPLQPAYAYAQGLETVDGWANLYPAVYRDIWLEILKPLVNANPENRKIFGFDTGKSEDNFIFLGADLVRPGIGLLPNEDLSNSLRTGFDISKRFNLNLLRMLNVCYILSEYPLKGEGISPYHEASPMPNWAQYRSRNTGLVEGDRQPPEMRLSPNLSLLQPFWDYYHFNKKKIKGKDIFVYRLHECLERFRFVRQINITSDKLTTLNTLSSMSIDDLKTTALIERKDSGLINRNSNLGIGTVILKDYSSDKIELTTRSEQDSFMVIANTWNPYWRATIDGVEITLIRVNHAQFGLPIKKGVHTITLLYRPPYSIFIQ